MRRTIVVVVVGLALALASGLPVSASVTPESLNAELTGPATGRTAYDSNPPVERCGGDNYVSQEFSGTYQTQAGTGTFLIRGCTYLSWLPGYSFSGTFTVTTPKGAAVSGPATGMVGSGNDYPGIANLQFALTVTSGTRRLRNAHGTISFVGAWWLDGPVIEGNLTGSVSAR